MGDLVGHKRWLHLFKEEACHTAQGNVQHLCTLALVLA